MCLGVGTKIDPTLCRADRMVGQVLGAVGALPEIFVELEISYFLLRRLLGVRTEGDKKGAKVTAYFYFCSLFSQPFEPSFLAYTRLGGWSTFFPYVPAANMSTVYRKLIVYNLNK